jgi:hypothetical protein
MMTSFATLGTLVTLSLVATPNAELATPAPTPLVTVSPECEPSEMPLEGRASPYDSVSVQLGEGEVKLCYGRPSARDRVMIGGDHVPYGNLWRTGANEPTVLHTTVPLSIGGVSVEPGSYALYTIPGETEWELFVSRSTEHWGLQIDDQVRGMEVGSTVLDALRTDGHVETLTFAFEDEGSRSASLVMEWEQTRIEIPITATGN